MINKFKHRNYFYLFFILFLFLILFLIFNFNYFSFFSFLSFSSSFSSSSSSSSSHKGIYPHIGNYLNKNLLFIPQFERYSYSNISLIPSWILSSSKVNTIHRFFDTSPFSPSGRYVGVTEINIKESRQVEVGDIANIILYDLFTGKKLFIDKTTAWDSQVGSHVQWGNNDNELYYNIIEYQSNSQSKSKSKSNNNNKKKQEIPRGKVIDIFTNQSRTFDCPIYQISPNGKYSASPDLTIIRYTQLGYGIFTSNSKPSHNASINNGLYLTDLTTGKCKLLVSLYDIAVYGNLPIDEPIYGFHVKWSSDNQMIMFVVRTLTSSILLSNGQRKSIKTARVNHIFAINATNGKILCHVVSWGSGCGSLNKKHYKTSSLSPQSQSQSPSSSLLSSYSSNQERITHYVGGIAVRGDGNHPNWIPGTHSISLNYLSVCDYPLKQRSKSIPVWKIAVFNVDEILQSKIELIDHPDETITGATRGKIVYPYGTGHPNYYPNSKYFITDAYLKEKRMFGNAKIPIEQYHNSINNINNDHIHSMNDIHNKLKLSDKMKKDEEDGAVMLPLRLVDTETQREVWLLEANLKRYKLPSSLTSTEKSYITSKSSLRWRCDMHPAFNKNFTWIAFNARPKGGLRQVMIGYLGDDPSYFFKH